MADSLHSFIAGDMDTARVRADEADEQRRRDNARNARGNLAAMMCEGQAGDGPLPRGLARPMKERIERGAIQAVQAQPQLQRGAAEQWTLLLEALGLDVAPRHRPGCCRRSECRKPLPMSAASSASHATLPYFKAGYCSPRCWAEARDGG